MITQEAYDWLKALQQESNRSFWAYQKGKDGPIGELLKETYERSNKAWSLALGTMSEQLLDIAKEALAATQAHKEVEENGCV